MIKSVLKFEGNTEASSSQPSIGLVARSHALGFTESFWWDLATAAGVANRLRTIVAPARARILPQQISLIGATLYSEGTGRGIEVPLDFGGFSVGSTDQVNVAGLVETRHGTAPNQRRWWLHALPDNWVTLGELRIPVAEAVKIRTYFDAISDAFWLGIAQTNLSSILTVSAAGLVTLSAASPFAVGQQLQVNRTLLTSGLKKGGKYFVFSVGPLATQFTLEQWDLGATTGGKIFLPTPTFYNIGNGEGPYLVRAGTKRVGRPFSLYRGRQPVRRT